MKGKTTLALLFVAVILMAYLYFFEKKSLTTEEKIEREDRVYSFEPEEIEKVRITTPEEDVVLEKHHRKWKMTRPVKTDTDEALVGSLLSGLAGLKITQRIAPEEGEDISWPDFGLSDPAVQVRFQRKDGETEQGFLLGKKSAIGDQLYARPLDENILWVLPDTALDTFNKASSDLRDRRIVRVDQGAVTGFEIHYAIQGRDRMVFTRESGGAWAMRTPDVSKADETAVSTMLAGIVNLRAKSFVSETGADLPAYGLDRPEIHLILREGEKSTALDFGAATKAAGDGEKACYCRLEGVDTVYTVAAEERDKLYMTPEDMRNKKITHFKTENVRAVTLAYPDVSIRCEKDEGGEWWLRQPGHYRCDGWTVDQYVSMVAALKTQRFLSLPPGRENNYDLDPPKLAINLTVKGRKKPVVVKLGKSEPEGDGVFALSSQGGDLYVVEAGMAGNLIKRAFDFRLKEVFNFLLDDLALLEIEQGETLYQFKKEGGSWRMLSPAERTLERADMSDLTVKFSYLEMSGIPEEAPDLSEAGLSPPKMKIGVRLADQEEMRFLLIGGQVMAENQGEPFYAMMAGQEEVFYIAPFVYEGIASILKEWEHRSSE